MMRLEIDDQAAAFHAGDRLAGRYVIADEYKPYLHPLRTPAGHTVSLLSPHDHKHHKGLMYALRTPEVNFWEERSTVPGEVPGRQRHERFRVICESGEEVGFEEELAWLPFAGGDPIFREVRSVSCREETLASAYAWTWATDIEARCDVELRMSQWSAQIPDGRLVNYHGLGIRFRRDFGCTGGNALLIDGTTTPFAEGMGSVPRMVEFRGSLDGTWPIQHAAVRIRQEQDHGLFVMETPFAFMGLGPSNLGSVHLRAGDHLVERYTITVLDLATD